MAIILELQYGKKLGLPEYSSHNFSVSLKTEAASLDQIPQEVERAYHILQQAVDSQITNPGYVPGTDTQSSPNLQIGKAVHAGLEAYHHAKWEGGDISTPAIIEAYHEAYRRLEEEDPVEYGDKDREQCIATGERTLRAYLDSELANDERPIRGVEAYLRRDPDILPLPLVGVLDLVRDGGVPVDFKTAATTPNLEEEAWAHDLQMVAYWLLLSDATGELAEPAELVYLVKTKMPKVIRHQLPAVSQTQVERFRRLTEVYVDAVRRQDYYPSPGMHCRWCAFRNQCRAWNGQQQAA